MLIYSNFFVFYLVVSDFFCTFVSELKNNIMCLTIKNYDKCIVAEEDIKCYKVIRLETGGIMKSFYFNFLYTFNKTYETTLLKTRYRKNYKIENGFHSFAKLNHTITFYDVHLRMKYFALVECTIPKGANYYMGKYNNRCAFVSDKIRINKIIPKESYINKYYVLKSF